MNYVWELLHPEKLVIPMFIKKLKEKLKSFTKKIFLGVVSDNF